MIASPTSSRLVNECLKIIFMYANKIPKMKGLDFS